jgi:DNA-binding IclR family transcriptional regulator
VTRAERREARSRAALGALPGTVAEVATATGMDHNLAHRTVLWLTVQGFAREVGETGARRFEPTGKEL